MLLASSKSHIEMMCDKCLNYGHFVKIMIITIHLIIVKSQFTTTIDIAVRPCVTVFYI